MEPQIAKKEPAVLALEPGTYWWCACGLSKTQPFCDSSHKGSGMAPLKFTLAESERVVLCQCKHSGNKPFCDGTHKAL